MILNETPVLANSLWTATAITDGGFPALNGSADAEIVVIGAGVTGLSAALNLAERGIATVVVEARTPGWGASGRNGGQLNPGLKIDPDAVVKQFGDEIGERMLRLSGEAPTYVMGLVRKHNIECDAVQTGWITPAHDLVSMRALEARARQWRPFGAELRTLSAEETSAAIGTETYVGGLLDPRGANLHPLNYTLGLARAALGKGARIFCHARAKSLKKSGGSFVVETEAGQVRARRVLVCTNAETDGLFPALARTIVPIRSVQVATAPLPEDIRRIVLPGRHAVADSRRVMIYYKMDRAGRLLMGGRGDHSDATTRKLLENLRRIARRLFPQIGNVPFEYAWGGHVAMTADHYPHVTALGDDILSVVGFNGRGLALGTAMGRVLADWAAGTPESELDFPVTPLRQIRLHALHRPAARAAVLLFRLRDALGI